jgi:hypothetical protein
MRDENETRGLAGLAHGSKIRSSILRKKGFASEW